ncbi:heme exporter protein CcmD [Parapedomonas caeni]|jgi:heme exporter protein CcmD
MSGFLAMGGYAPYIWTAYAVVAVWLTGLGLVSWRRMRQLEAAADALRAQRRAER